MRYTYAHSTGLVQADQESTIDSLLEKYGLTNCNSSKVSIRPDTDLAGLPISPLAEKATMKSAFCVLIGELMYIAINTRPEIRYAVNQCSRYMTKATKAHYEVLKHILEKRKKIHGSWRKCLRAGFRTPVEGKRDRWSD